jgi:hypothetical protein
LFPNETHFRFFPLVGARRHLTSIKAGAAILQGATDENSERKSEHFGQQTLMFCVFLLKSSADFCSTSLALGESSTAEARASFFMIPQKVRLGI